MFLDRRYIEYFGGISLLTILYVGAAEVGLSLAYIHNSVSAIWPPTGIALAVLLLFGYRWWPGIFLGAFLANFTHDVSVLTAIGIGIGNALEALIGAYLVVQFAHGVRAFYSVKDLVRFVAVAAIAGPAVSASFGVTSLYFGGYLAENDTAAVWFTWWLGDAVSAIVLAPFLILWAVSFRFPWNWKQGLELLSLFVLLVMSDRMIFGEVIIGDRGHPIFLMPLFVWVALRFSSRETMSAALVTAILAAWGTLDGFGPFSGRPSMNESLILLQLFVGVVSVTSLLLAVIVQERKHAERALQKADQAKDDFLSALSHELRNPLSAAYGFLELIRHEPLREQGKKVLTDMSLELRQMSALLEDLLDLSRVRRGRLRLQLQPVDVNKTVSEAVVSVGGLMNEHRHTLTAEYSKEALWIHADPGRVKQVLLNLLVNAAKYMDTGGTVHVKTARKGDWVEISVMDTGFGLEKERIDYIFDMYSMANRSIPHAQSGLGIGLTLVRRLMDMHGGTVRAESEGVGKGSTFTVAFRFLPGEQIPPVIELPEHAGGEKKPRNILLVDDNVKAADVLASLLKQFGHNVRIAYSGSEALEKTSREAADVVILDIGLPDMDGYEVAKQLIQQRRTLDMPQPLLIALSGYGRDEDRQRALEAGFNEHLVKPVDTQTLQAVVMKKS